MYYKYVFAGPTGQVNPESNTGVIAGEQSLIIC